MRALVVTPNHADSTRLVDIPQPDVHADRQLVPGNDDIFGSVNANGVHDETASTALVRADRAWPSRLITRRVALDEWPHAFAHQPDDVKVTIEFEPHA